MILFLLRKNSVNIKYINIDNTNNCNCINKYLYIRDHKVCPMLDPIISTSYIMLKAMTSLRHIFWSRLYVYSMKRFELKLSRFH